MGGFLIQAGLGAGGSKVLTGQDTDTDADTDAMEEEAGITEHLNLNGLGGAIFLNGSLDYIFNTDPPEKNAFEPDQEPSSVFVGVGARKALPNAGSYPAGQVDLRVGFARLKYRYYVNAGPAILNQPIHSLDFNNRSPQSMGDNPALALALGGGASFGATAGGIQQNFSLTFIRDNGFWVGMLNYTVNYGLLL